MHGIYRLDFTYAAPRSMGLHHRYTGCLKKELYNCIPDVTVATALGIPL
jgi:hypothetical protein